LDVVGKDCFSEPDLNGLFYLTNGEVRIRATIATNDGRFFRYDTTTETIYMQ